MKYLGSITDDNDIVTKKYVDDAISGGTTEYDYTSTLTPSIDARGVTAYAFYVTPSNTADLTVDNARKIGAYLSTVFTASAYSGVYNLLVTQSYPDTTNNYFVIRVKSINASPQSTSATYVSGTFHIVAPFVVSSVVAGK